MSELTSQEIAQLREKTGDDLLHESVYRVVATSLYLLCVDNLKKHQMLVFSEQSEITESFSGYRLLQTIRYLIASFYGLLAPQVFGSWGVKHDRDVARIIKAFADTGHLPKFSQEAVRNLLNGRYYRGKSVLRPVSFDETTTFDWVQGYMSENQT
jgi:uncharacterized repeat protein (TIGR04138 family)